MTEFYAFAGEHPVFVFLLAWLLCWTMSWPFRLVNRWIRHRNIAAKGWPPFHLDADGDTRSFDEDDIAALKAGAAAQSNAPVKSPAKGE
jgi:hypothetical protein